MGTWGTALYSDDLASDVRESFLMLVGEGASPQKATKQLSAEYSDLEDDEEPIFWIALAHTQWKYGKLIPSVKRRAVSLIKSGADLERWDSPSDRKKRSGVLAKVLAEIRSIPASPKKVKKTFRDDTEWKIGEVIGYELKSGTRILLRVCGYHKDDGGRAPIVEIFKWTGKSTAEFPKREEILKMKLCSPKSLFLKNFFMIGRTSQRSYPEKRIFRLNIITPPVNTKLVPLPIALWQWLDQRLMEDYKIK